MLEVDSLAVSYGTGGLRTSRTRVVDDVSFTVGNGEIVGLVGESGCGKTTVARAIVGAVPPVGGAIALSGRALGRRRPADVRRRIQMVFQDPGSSLDPGLTVSQTLAFASAARRADRLGQAEVTELLEQVGLPGEVAAERPQQLSGGQRQRVAIARALATRPEVVVADEVVASLDVSAAGAVLNLLRMISRDLGVSVLFISHDLSVVRNLCDRTMVMYLGQIVEQAPTDRLFERPGHPYTWALIDSIPSTTERRQALSLLGDDAGPSGDHGTGCRFRGRCPLATEVCAAQEPVLEGHAHRVRCHHARHTAAEVP